MVPKSAEVLHQRLLDTVMGAPLSFFTSTDTGTTINRQVPAPRRPLDTMCLLLFFFFYRFSQDMTVIDAELPYALVDFSLSIVIALMGAVLMCLSAGYFTITIPPVVLSVWGK